MNAFYPKTGQPVNVSPAVSNITAHVPPSGLMKNRTTLLKTLDEIIYIHKQNGCFYAENAYLARKVGVSVATICRAISRLFEIGAIKVLEYRGLAREIIPLFSKEKLSNLLKSQLIRFLRSAYSTNSENSVNSKEQTIQKPVSKAKESAIPATALVVVLHEKNTEANESPTIETPLPDPDALAICREAGVVPHAVAVELATHHAAEVKKQWANPSVQRCTNKGGGLRSAVREGWAILTGKAEKQVRSYAVQVPKENHANHAAYEQITAPVQNHAPAPPTPAESPKNGQNSDISPLERQALSEGDTPTGRMARERQRRLGLSVPQTTV